MQAVNLALHPDMRPRLDLWDAPLLRRLQPIRCHYVSDGGCA
jgi:hypothetical protein